MTHHYITEMIPRDIILDTMIIVYCSLAWSIISPFYILGKGLEYSNEIYNKKKEELE